MARKLGTTVEHGGVIYPAGTPEAEVTDADKITADVWDDEGAEAKKPAARKSAKG